MQEEGSSVRLSLILRLAGLVLIGWLVFAYLLAPLLIRYAYGVEGVPLLESILSGRDVHPVDRYLAHWRDLANTATAILVPIVAVALLLALPSVDSFLNRRLGRPETVRLRAQMPVGRLVVAHGAILLLAGGAAFHIATDSESWPYSNYPMYSNLAREEIKSVRLYGVTSGGEEFPLNRTSYVRPFDHNRLTHALRKIAREAETAGEEGPKQALDYVLGRYDMLRRQGAHDGPALCGLRFYELRWTVRPGAPNRDRPDARDFLWEISECPAGGGV